MEYLLLIMSFLPLAYANHRLLVDLTALETLLKTFPGCDVMLITKTLELSNLDRVENPLVLYWGFEKRNEHYINYLPFGAPISARAIYASDEAFKNKIRQYIRPTHQNIVKGGKCKVQVVLDVKGRKSGSFHEIFLSSVLESATAYTLFIHTVGSPPRQSETKGSVKALYDQYYRPFINWGRCDLALSHVYLALVSTIKARAENGGHRMLLRSPAILAQNFSLFSLCVYCDESAGKVLSFVADSSDTSWLKRAERLTHNTLHEFHQESSDQSGRARYVSFSNLDKEFIIPGPNYSFKTIFSVVEKLAKKESKRRKFQLHRFEVSPELLMIFEIQRKFQNNTIKWIKPRDEKFDRLKCVSDEYIKGTGHYAHRNYRAFHYPLIIPTEHVSLIFVTYDNVTAVSSVVSFSAPFDAASWAFALGCSSVVAAFLCLSLRRTGGESRCLTAVLIIWRIFVENFHDVHLQRKANVRTYAILTVVTAMVGIVLSNGYKGVLTSYLAAAPTFSGPIDIEGILADSWKFLPYTNEWNKFLKRSRKANATIDAKARMEVHMDMFNRVFAFFRAFLYPSGESVKNFTLLETWLDYNMSNLQKPTEELNQCNLTKGALLTPSSEVGKLQDIYLPPSCDRLRGIKTFIVGKEALGPTTIGWYSYGRGQPGAAFRALQRMVEAGIQLWLENFIRRSGVKYKVTTGLVVEPLRKEIPLSLGTPLIESTFKLWYRLLALALAVAFLEMFCGICGSLFQWVPLAGFEEGRGAEHNQPQ